MANTITAATQAHVETIIDAMPPYYVTSNILRDILAAWVQKTDGVNSDNEDLIKQLYVQTATWGLIYWENDYGIVADINESYEIRRAEVMAKMLGNVMFTKHSAKLLANMFSANKTAEYITILNDYAFKTRHDIDDLLDFFSLRSSFDNAKPAHLQHIIGLIIRLLMNVDEDLHTKIGNGLYTAMYDQEFKTAIKINAYADVAGYSFIYSDGLLSYQPNGITRLCLDGTWDINGSEKLSGKRSDIMNLYIAASEILSERIKSKVVLDADLQHTLRASLAVAVAADNYLNYESREKIHVSINVPAYTFIANIGEGNLNMDGSWNLSNNYVLNGKRNDMPYTPDTIGRLYTDGSWDLDSTYLLNGHKDNIIQQFVEHAEALRITTKVNNSVQAVEIV